MLRRTARSASSLPWWRTGTGREISARRLDGPDDGRVKVSIPSGYGDTGFQSSAVYFSAPGCWEVTGTVATTSLTFVTLVRAP